jgi:hypothetical protein
MSCCNRRRARLATGSPGPALRPAPPAWPWASSGPARAPDPTSADAAEARAAEVSAAEVRLRFTGSRRVRVEGVVSGRIYRASPAAPLITASQQDVRSLLRSGLFTQAQKI